MLKPYRWRLAKLRNCAIPGFGLLFFTGRAELTMIWSETCKTVDFEASWTRGSWIMLGFLTIGISSDCQICQHTVSDLWLRAPFLLQRVLRFSEAEWAGVFGRLLFHWVTMPQAASRIDCSIAWNNRIGLDMSGLKPFDFDSFQQIQQMCLGLGQEIWSSGNQRFLIPAHSTLWVLLRARATLSPSFKPLGTALSRWRSQKMRNPQSPPNEIGHNHIRVCVYIYIYIYIVPSP